jgi:hypothetical protein
LSLWDWEDESDPWGGGVADLSKMTGAKLYNGAHDLCLAQMPDSCRRDAVLLTQLYSAQIRSDCAAFGNAVAKMQVDVDEEYASAEKAVRDARLASFESANEYNRGECMLNFRKCMTGADVCGADWGNCVGFIAAENMQNNKRTTNVSREKVAHIAKFEITDTTMEIMDAKRNICEGVLDKCVAVRDNVWTDFLREVAPSLKLAELNAESQKRMSCLTDISSCIQKACKDDIEGKGVATMDSCLSRPEMARSFCKNQIETCERMEPLIWGYVTDKLASMRVDRCTEEVKTCFTDRCGADFSQCIGMDYDYMHDICPLDKLVVCKQNNPNFSMSDIDSMLMGLYLNVDNAALENCQNLVETKMKEICDSTTDCNVFAADDKIGTGSLQSQKDGSVYRITGMISFGSIKIGGSAGEVKDSGVSLKAGQIGVKDYINTAMTKNTQIKNLTGITETIDAELNNIAGTINRAVELIEKDPRISYCVNGRDLSQITGVKRGANDSETEGRFPHLLDQTKMLIAQSALRKANENYTKKLNAEISKATRDASVDLAQYMCQMMPMNGGAGVGAKEEVDTPLVPPYAVSIEIGSGLTMGQLMQGGHDRADSDGYTYSTESGHSSKQKNVGKDTAQIIGATNMTAEGAMTQAVGLMADAQVAMVRELASSKSRMETPGGYKEMWSLFNRETRNCHYCTLTVTVDCKTKGSRGFLGLWDNRGVDCQEIRHPEVCEDIAM